MLMNIRIRDMDERDAPEINALSEELGYSRDVESVREHLRSLCASPEHFVYIAFLEEVPVGFIHGFMAIRLTSIRFLEIAALVVHSNYRGKGIGKKLVNYLEEQIPSGISFRVRCNVKRHIAHRFYQKLQFREIKEQKVFEKLIE